MLYRNLRKRHILYRQCKLIILAFDWAAGRGHEVVVRVHGHGVHVPLVFSQSVTAYLLINYVADFDQVWQGYSLRMVMGNAKIKIAKY
jgi:hypothetical protein